MLRNVFFADDKIDVGMIAARVECDILQEILQNGMEPSGADIFKGRIHPARAFGDLIQRLLRKGQMNAVRAEELRILPDQRVFRLCKDPSEILSCKALEPHPYREPPLQFRDEIAHFGNVERTGGNEQDKISLYRTVLGAYRSSFHDRKDVSLNALSGNVRSVRMPGARDLVDLIDEDDPVLFGALNGNTSSISIRFSHSC